MLRAVLLEQLVASLLAASTLLQDDNNFFQICEQLGTILRVANSDTALWNVTHAWGFPYPAGATCGVLFNNNEWTWFFLQ